MVQIGVSASSSAATLGSSSTALPARRVAPNAASWACRQSTSRARANSSTSLGLEPGQPPSIIETPI